MIHSSVFRIHSSFRARSARFSPPAIGTGGIAPRDGEVDAVGPVALLFEVGAAVIVIIIRAVVLHKGDVRVEKRRFLLQGRVAVLDRKSVV